MLIDFTKAYDRMNDYSPSLWVAQLAFPKVYSREDQLELKGLMGLKGLMVS